MPLVLLNLLSILFVCEEWEKGKGLGLERGEGSHIVDVSVTTLDNRGNILDHNCISSSMPFTSLSFDPYPLQMAVHW